MKKLVVSLVAIASITFYAQAQTQRNNNDVNKEYVKHPGKKDQKQMAKNLDLSNDQKQQMKSISMDFKNRMQELKNSNLSESELKAKRETLLQERKQKMMVLLTPEQKNKFAEYKNFKHGGEKNGSGNKIEKLKERLSLSDEQVKKLDAQRVLYNSKEETIKNNQALTTEQKKLQLKSLREEQKNSFKSILTTDQLKKMEEMKEKRNGKVTS